jgi:hypothetical protein
VYHDSSGWDGPQACSPRVSKMCWDIDKLELKIEPKVKCASFILCWISQMPAQGFWNPKVVWLSLGNQDLKFYLPTKNTGCPSPTDLWWTAAANHLECMPGGQLKCGTVGTCPQLDVRTTYFRNPATDLAGGSGTRTKLWGMNLGLQPNSLHPHI